MRKGQTVPDDMPLERIGQSHPATRAKLMEIEARAFERSGRLDELRRAAGLPATKTDAAKKEKIIGKLTQKASTASSMVEAPAKKALRAAKKVITAAKRAITAAPAGATSARSSDRAKRTSTTIAPAPAKKSKTPAPAKVIAPAPAKRAKAAPVAKKSTRKR